MPQTKQWIKMVFTIRSCKFDSDIANRVAHLFQNGELNTVKTSEYFEWRYRRCFSDGTKLVLLEVENELVGMAAIFEQTFLSKKKVFKIAQLGDLIVHPDHRSIKAVRLIYRELSQQLMNGRYDGIFTLPNTKSTKLNRYFLKLENKGILRGYFNIVVPKTSPKIINTYIYSSDCHQEKTRKILSEYIKPSAQNAMNWTVNQVIDRISDPRFEYGLVATKNALIISSKRMISGVPYALIMSSAMAADQQDHHPDFRKLVSATAALHKTCFVISFPPINNGNTFGGIKIPDFIHGSSHHVQTKTIDKRIGNIANCIGPLDLDIF